MKKITLFIVLNLAFTLFSFSQSTCATAQNITVLTTSATSINFDLTSETVNNEMGCDGSTPQDYADIWYEFTMPVNGNISINSSIAWNRFSLYDVCNGTEIHCQSNDALIDNLLLGTTYKLRVYRTAGLAQNLAYQSFTIQAFETPTNDICSLAENITVTTASATTINFELTGASINNEMGCDASSPQDYATIWYEFTMPVNGNISINSSIAWNRFSLYDVCNGTEIHCQSNDALIDNLILGTTYKLRVYRTAGLAQNLAYQSFTIQAFETPTNDTCSLAENITVTTASATTINFELTGASINNEMGCDGSTPQDYAAIWYEFTMPVNGNISINSSIAWNRFSFYDVCNGTEIHCQSSDALIDNLILGTTYKLRVYRTADLAQNLAYQSFTIQAFETPTNDTCSLAENITVTTASATTINFELTGAEINNEMGCDGSTPQDYAAIWYEFTMPVDGSVTIDGTIGWNNFALYDSCTGTELACFSNNGVIENLINATTYKLRVYRTAGFAQNLAYQSFTIQSSSTLNIENFTEKELSIYPNPATSIVTIQRPQHVNITKVEVFDVSGKKIQTLSLIDNTIDVSQLQSGLYFVAVTTNQNTVIKKMIVR